MSPYIDPVVYKEYQAKYQREHPRPKTIRMNLSPRPCVECGSIIEKPDKRNTRFCSVKCDRAWRAVSRNPSPSHTKQALRARRLRDKYGMTIEAFDELLASQNGLCAICRANTPELNGWAVDHDHETNEVRGILCNHCNSGIGQMRDNPAFLRAAADYLERA